MAIAAGISKQIRIKTENEFGVAPTTDSAQIIRKVSGSFNLNKGSYESNEMRNDLQTAEFRHGDRTVEGTLSGELSRTTFKELYEGTTGKEFYEGEEAGSIDRFIDVEPNSTDVEIYSEIAETAFNPAHEQRFGYLGNLFAIVGGGAEDQLADNGVNAGDRIQFTGIKDDNSPDGQDNGRIFTIVNSYNGSGIRFYTLSPHPYKDHGQQKTPISFYREAAVEYKADDKNFTDEGFVAGRTVEISGFSNPENNGTKTIKKADGEVLKIEGTNEIEETTVSATKFSTLAYVVEPLELKIVPDSTISGKCVVELIDGIVEMGKLHIGDIVTMKSFANEENNNNYSRIIGLEDEFITLLSISGTPFVAEQKTGVGGKVIGLKTIIPSLGHLNRSFAIEQYFADIGQSELFLGNKITTMNVKIPASGLVSIDFNFTGKDKTSQTAEYFVNPVEVTKTSILSSAIGEIFVKDKIIALVSSADFTVERGVEAQSGAFGDLAHSIREGRHKVTGTIVVKFVNQEFDTLFDDEDEFSLGLTTRETKAKDGHFVNFHFPRIKLTGTKKDDGEKEILQTLTFVALKNTDETNGLDVTQFTIQES